MSFGLIILTYKGKALLMHKQKNAIDPVIHTWSFISCVQEKKETLEKTLARNIQKEMGIKIENIEYISENYYHARLSDHNVNSIQRSENQLLDFFTLKEANKLNLSQETKEFILKHGMDIFTQNSNFS